MTKKDVKELALSFQAYCEARTDKRDNGIIVWGRMLLRAQENTGVELLEPSTVEAMIGYAQKNEARANAFFL